MTRSIGPVALATILQALILLLPLALASGAPWATTDVPILLFFATALAHGLCEGLASRHGGDDSGSPLVRSCANRYLALLTGLALLTVSWISLATHVLAAAPGFTPNPICIGLGVLSMAAGVMLRCCAIAALGTGFVSASQMPADRPLVRSGLYGVLRHPSETGLLAIALGIPVMLQSWLGFVFVATVFLPLCLYRVRREEQALRAAFPEDYANYAAHTGAYLPRWLAVAGRRGGGDCVRYQPKHGGSQTRHPSNRGRIPPASRANGFKAHPHPSEI